MIYRGVTKILTFKCTVMTISVLFVVNKLGLNYTMWKFGNTNTRSIPYIIQKNQSVKEYNLVFENENLKADDNEEETPINKEIDNVLSLDILSFSDEKVEKKILLWDGIGSIPIDEGNGIFFEQNCSVNRCSITTNRTDYRNSDIVMFKDFFSSSKESKPKKQIWMMYMVDNPPLMGKGEIMNIAYFCRICEIIHKHRHYDKVRYIKNFNEWWNGEGSCIIGASLKTKQEDYKILYILKRNKKLRLRKKTKLYLFKNVVTVGLSRVERKLVKSAG